MKGNPWGFGNAPIPQSDGEKAAPLFRRPAKIAFAGFFAAWLALLGYNVVGQTLYHVIAYLVSTAVIMGLGFTAFLLALRRRSRR